jgi:cytochrome c
MDSFEFNKIVAAVLLALLVIKGADLISQHLIHPKMLKENVFQIEGVQVTAQAGETVEKKGPAPIEPLLAAANVAKGAEIFKKCTSCHTAEKGGPNKIGPDLYNVVGAPKAKHPGYSYSQAMSGKGGNWTFDDLNVYLFSPRDFVPGTKMSFVGIKDDQERADVIAYLRQQSDAPLPLPAVKPAAAPAPVPAQGGQQPPPTAPAPGGSAQPQQPTPQAPAVQSAPTAPSPHGGNQ